MLLEGIKDSTIIRIHGEFPKVRYFSYQTYEMPTGVPMASLPDYRIIPDDKQKLNPYSSKPKGNTTEKNTYTIYITPKGDHGLKNEIPILNSTTPASKCNDSPNGCSTVLFLRLYIGEANYNPFDKGDDIVNWGYVAPPQVTQMDIFNEDGFFMNGGSPKEYCNEAIRNSVTQKLYVVQATKLEEVNKWEGSEDWDNKNNNFIIYTGRKNFTPFPNQDSSYLFASANPELVAPMALLMKITGKLPVTPNSLTEPIYIGDAKNYEVRYFSLSTINPATTQPTYDAIIDKHVIEFMKTNQPNNKEGRFSIIAGPDQELAQKCGLLKDNESLFLSTVPRDAKGKSTYKRMKNLVAFVFREILSREQLYGGVDKSVSYAFKQCQLQGGNACYQGANIKKYMDDEYPTIEYFVCDPRDYSMIDYPTYKKVFLDTGLQDSSVDVDITDYKSSGVPGTLSSLSSISKQYLGYEIGQNIRMFTAEDYFK